MTPANVLSFIVVPTKDAKLKRRILVGAVVAVITALVIGVPTGIIESSWYTRMTPVL